MDNFQPYMLMMMSSFKNDGTSNIYLYIAIFLVTVIPKIIPFNDLKTMICDYININNNIVTINISSHEVPIVRMGSNNNQTKLLYSESFLAIIYYLTTNKISNVNSLTEIIANNSELNFRYDSNDYDKYKDDKYIFMPINNKKILISEKYDIYFELITIKKDDDDNSEKKKDSLSTQKNKFIIILSKNKSFKNNKKIEKSDIEILKLFLDECIKDYRLLTIDLNDKKQYIFEYKQSEKIDNRLELHFDKYLLEHNKNLKKNIFFEDKQKLINYIDPFVYDPNQLFNLGEEKYKRSGFTFKAGLLFYGSPGCGKTSTIKAILKYTNRHGIIINLSRVKTCEELENIFRKRKFDKKDVSGKQLCYILEDCDAFENNIISTRKDKKDKYKEKDKEKNIQKDGEEKNDILNMARLIEATCSSVSSRKDDDELNLSCFLNILDGIIELHGIMIILTTNYPEKIDDALIRPGRIDFKYEFKKTTKKIIKEMLQFKFDLSDSEMEKYMKILNVKDGILSPAEVQSICFKNENITECIKEIVLACQPSLQ
jgi:hypothetical protein